MQNLWKTKREIREFLHPTLDKNYLPRTANNPLKVKVKLIK